MVIAASIAGAAGLWAGMSDLRRREIPLTASAIIAGAGWLSGLHGSAELAIDAVLAAGMGAALNALAWCMTGRAAIGAGDILLVAACSTWTGAFGVPVAYLAILAATALRPGRSVPAALPVLAATAIGITLRMVTA